MLYKIKKYIIYNVNNNIITIQNLQYNYVNDNDHLYNYIANQE